MSLTGALYSAISALNAQSRVLGMVSDNLANVSTYGYKTVYGSFEDMVSNSSPTDYSSGGVSVFSRYNISQEGTLVASATKTNVAIDGNGFFAVRSNLAGGDIEYTRNGEFSTDQNGLLTNNGSYLLGWKTDAEGNVIGSMTAGGLTPIDTSTLSSTASATTTAALKANLPAESATGATYTSSMELEDSLGTKAQTTITWTKTGDNTWTASFANPTKSGDTSGTTIGTVTGGSVTVTFNADGTLATTSPSPPTLAITGWTTGAKDSSVALDLGTAGSATGLTQYSSGATTPSVSLAVTQNGVAFGSLTSIYVDNSQTVALYKVPVATFNNPDGLTVNSGGIYTTSADSGAATLNLSGTGGAGTVMGGELEASTTDTNEQFSTMMASQQAYSAAAQVVTTTKSMFDTLISAVR